MSKRANKNILLNGGETMHYVLMGLVFLVAFCGTWWCLCKVAGDADRDLGIK